ncbi:hypothetical protein DO97_06270 [Neosynechococcus sphagnicola sy1]|uniref:Uncharacterized protein n=1 Tax=Neosynechococcus sphagnicola sy1 TaxID=1497020 RepID=A0A098TNS0_9CYAN|nr:hypothetical protein [Neosynechococcus sphagnicola]KGF73939.1 hypothetical protein DO97_06270 [Neosynechococcus sphagnicola sy1]
MTIAPKGNTTNVSPGYQRSQKLHQTADMVKGQYTTGVDSLPLQVLPQPLNRRHQGFPGMDGKPDVAGRSPRWGSEFCTGL